MSYPADIDVVFNNNDAFNCDMDSETTFHCEMGEGISSEIYHGPVTVTPSEDIQVLNTEGMVIEENIVIEPIPSNYGLITWNGSVLIVS